eukprot:5320309-Amphidinium_carterae.1
MELQRTPSWTREATTDACDWVSSNCCQLLACTESCFYLVDVQWILPRLDQGLCMGQWTQPWTVPGIETFRKLEAIKICRVRCWDDEGVTPQAHCVLPVSF